MDALPTSPKMSFSFFQGTRSRETVSMAMSLPDLLALIETLSQTSDRAAVF